MDAKGVGVNRTTQSSPERRGVIDLVWPRESPKKKMIAGKLGSLGLEGCPKTALVAATK